MALPDNINKEHLLKAISKIDSEGIPKHGSSTFYDVFYRGKKYPPKLIVSYANYFANGEILDRNTFHGGEETKCFKLLEDNGFVIKEKGLSHYLVGAIWKAEGQEIDLTEKFIQNGVWENGYENKFKETVNEVEQGDRIALKSTFATRKGDSVLRIKARGTVVENHKNGKTLNVNWEKDFIPFDLYGMGSYRRTIQRVSKKDVHKIFTPKNDNEFAEELKNFLTQSQTDNLKTKQFRSEYRGTIVKVSFGQGNQARIPWISFLVPPNKTSQGIYPVYLYYKIHEILILAYGISESAQPELNWQIASKQSINEYFEQNELGKPERYGGSYIFKVYDAKQLPDNGQLDLDLYQIIESYKMVTLKQLNVHNERFDSKLCKEQISLSGLVYSDSLVVRFLASLLTKPFVILTGLSGSGKTKIAQAFVQWISENEDQYLVVPVGADWTNREPLLGYPNALEPEKYVKPDSGVLDLIIRANNNPDIPYFLILDEMNLSHVERYFADFLSSMESKEPISLYPEGQVVNGVPSTLSIPSNLFIIGTVNIDETTNMFSPKVLDRANTIEFRVAQDEMKNFLANIKDINMDSLTGQGAGMAKSFLEMAKNKAFETDDLEKINDTLLRFFGELKQVGAEFGYRSASEMLRLINQLTILDGELGANEKLDIAIIQKLLPKLHGSRRKLISVLEVLGSFCVNTDVKIVEDVFNKPDFDFNGANVLFPLSLEKIARMYKGAIENGFTSFAEA